MEATATWAEDEVFDKINDNAFYLPHGPIAHPTTPLDTFGSSNPDIALYQYGAWVFFRYLTDRYGTKVAGLDNLVLKMWRGAGGRERAKYSLASVRKVLQAQGLDLTEEFAEFSAGNRRPAITYAAEYDEVAADPENAGRYPTAPLQAPFTMGPSGSPNPRANATHLTASPSRVAAQGAHTPSARRPTHDKPPNTPHNGKPT